MYSNISNLSSQHLAIDPNPCGISENTQPKDSVNNSAKGLANPEREVSRCNSNGTKTAERLESERKFCPYPPPLLRRCTSCIDVSHLMGKKINSITPNKKFEEKYQQKMKLQFRGEERFSLGRSQAVFSPSDNLIGILNGIRKEFTVDERLAVKEYILAHYLGSKRMARAAQYLDEFSLVMTDNPCTVKSEETGHFITRLVHTKLLIREPNDLRLNASAVGMLDLNPDLSSDEASWLFHQLSYITKPPAEKVYSGLNYR